MFDWIFNAPLVVMGGINVQMFLLNYFLLASWKYMFSMVAESCHSKNLLSSKIIFKCWQKIEKKNLLYLKIKSKKYVFLFFLSISFFRIVGNVGNNGKDGKLHKSGQILDQTTRNINKLCLGKIPIRKTLRIKFSVDSGFFCRFLIIWFRALF